MTDWKRAGELADAHRVQRLLASRYQNAAKITVRSRAIRFLASVQPTCVLDAWGGGMSAEELVRYGLAVLSVDNGGDFANVGVSRSRGFRALRIAGEEGGYRTAVGALSSHADAADAAFLDFMGHWGRDVARTVWSCRHMKALVVTLMPERVPVGRQSLTRDEWATIYKALLVRSSGMRVVWTHEYRRTSGLPAFVFALRAPATAARRTCSRQGCGANVLGHPNRRYCTVTCREAVHKARRSLAEVEAARERRSATRTRDRARENLMERLRRRDDPDHAPRRSAAHKRWREKDIDAARERERAAAREYYAAHREERLAYAREYKQRKRTLRRAAELSAAA